MDPAEITRQGPLGHHSTSHPRESGWSALAACPQSEDDRARPIGDGSSITCGDRSGASPPRLTSRPRISKNYAHADLGDSIDRAKRYPGAVAPRPWNSARRSGTRVTELGNHHRTWPTRSSPGPGAASGVHAPLPDVLSQVMRPFWIGRPVAVPGAMSRPGSGGHGTAAGRVTHRSHTTSGILCPPRHRPLSPPWPNPSSGGSPSGRSDSGSGTKSLR
jgi:hypothetical protein